MIEPPVRYATPQSIEFVAGRLGLPNDPTMQDWPFEVAKASDLDTYLSLFDEMVDHDDIRFTLADMILQAFEETDMELAQDPRWAKFLNDLVANIGLHAYQLWHWSAWDVGLEDAWRISPSLRLLSLKFLDQNERST